jgi:hypothetical protein
MINPEIGVAVGIPTAGVALWLTARGMKHAARDREMRHTERLKAIERGFILEDGDEERQFRKGLLKLAAGLGIAVPMFAVLCAAVAVINTPPSGISATAVFLIWTTAASIGVFGLGSGAWLASATLMRFRVTGSNHRNNPSLWHRSRVQPLNNN